MFWQSKKINHEPEKNIEVKDHISAVAKMFDMRRTIYRRLHKERAKKTLMCELWDSTEALIANAVEFNEVLKNDGYTESESIKKLLLSAQTTPGNGCPDLMSYLRFRLEKINPEYLSLGDEFLNQAVEIAKEAAEIEMKKRANNKGLETPSTEHLVAKFSYGDLINGSIFDYEGRKNELPYCTLPPHEYEGKRDWARFQLRAKPGDEIWVYLKPFFFFFIEKAALVRQGNVIDIVTAESPAVTLRINT